MIRNRVERARERQPVRFRGMRTRSNAEMGSAEAREFCRLESSAQSLLRVAMQQLNLSAWTYHRVLKPPRTIADPAGSDLIGPAHVAEAAQFRPRETV